MIRPETINSHSTHCSGKHTTTSTPAISSQLSKRARFITSDLSIASQRPVVAWLWQSRQYEHKHHRLRVGRSDPPFDINSMGQACKLRQGIASVGLRSASDDEMPAEQSFALFSSLPTEIRLEIWRCSCHARAVEVWYDPRFDMVITNTAAPAVLSACGESRREALKIYRKSFGTWTHEPTIYFDPWRDTLYLPRPVRMGYDEMSRTFSDSVYGTAEVVNLALDYVNPAIRKPWETYNKYAMMLSFPRVKEVLLVIDPPAHQESGEERELSRLEEPFDDAKMMSRMLAEVVESFVYEVGVDLETGYDQASRTPSLVLKAKSSLDRFHVHHYHLEHP